MKIAENLKNSLVLGNTQAVNDVAFKKLVENCFSVLIGRQEPYNMTNLYNSKADLVKEFYAALLSVTVQFIRNGETPESVSQFLGVECNFTPARISYYCDLFNKNREDIEGSLINIGSHLPHITDVTWKIDYIIKSSYLDSSQGPLFRVGFQTEKYDSGKAGKKIQFVSFTCDSRELQDLVYKLKDAIRHCQRIGSEH